MRMLVIVGLVIGCASCSSTARRASAPRPITSNASQPTATTNPIDIMTPSPSAVAASSDVDMCASADNPENVVKSFVLAAKAGNTAVLANCTYPGAKLKNDVVPGVASGDWLL